MGEPWKEQDPEKGHIDAPRPSIGEGITNIFSKAGEGITRGITKTAEGIHATGTTLAEGIHATGTTLAEGIHATGTTLKDGAKSAGAIVGLGSKTPQKQKKNPKRAKNEKKFQKSFKPIPHEEPKDTNAVGNITKLLPANTFLMFQTLAPLATNDGNCGQAEKIMTSAMLIILASTCMLVCFTDTVQFNGKVYHGLVTHAGLWNPSFKGDPTLKDLRLYEHELAQFYENRRQYKSRKRDARLEGRPVPPRPEEPTKPNTAYIMGSTYSSGNSQYQLNFTDFMHAILSAMAFGTLTLLTNPVSTCFYPEIPSTVVKTLPLLVGFVISAIFAFSPPARNGIAHPLSPKVPSPNDNYKPPDSKGVVHGPQLPPKPPGKGDLDAHGKPKPDDDDDDGLGGSLKKFLKGKFFGSPEQEKSPAAGEHHQALDGVKALTSGFFNMYGDDLKEGAAKMVHSMEDEVKKEASHLLLKAAPAVAELSKDIHVPLALQEAAKSVPHEELIAGLVNAGAHPTLAIAAVQSAAQGAKEAALNQLHQGLQSAMSAPLAGLTKQSSMALTRANSILESAGSSLSNPSAHDALFHQAAQVLQRQVSGLPPNVHTAGPEAAAIAYATGKALLQAGYQFPGGGQSPQAAAWNSFSGNLNLNSANALVKDATSLYQQGSKSLAEVHDELARQGASLSQGFQSSLFSFPASSALANSGSNQVAQGTFAATLAAGMAREAGTLLQEGADHGMAGVHAEIARQKAAAMQPVQDIVQQGSAEFLKQKEVLTHELNSQARALSAPATSVAQDIAALARSQSSVNSVNAQFVESLALGVAQGMAHQLKQPAASVAIDVSQMQAQLGRQASALSPQALSAAASMLQSQGSFGKFQQPSAQQVADSHKALRHFASQLSAQPASSSSEFGAFQSSSPPSWRDNASLIIEEVTDAAAAGQRGVERLQRGASQLSRVMEEVVAHAPSASQVRAESSQLAASTSEAAGQAVLGSVTRILRSDRPESTEIMDPISTDEITSESETELSNRRDFRAGSSTFNLQRKKS